MMSFYDEKFYDELGNNEEVLLGRRFIHNDDCDNNFDFSSGRDDNDNDKISNFTVGAALEPENEEGMEEHDKLYEDQLSYRKSKAQKF